MVNRLFLTLLALLTGLAAQTGPAHAGMRGGEESEIGVSIAELSVEQAEQVAHRLLADITPGSGTSTGTSTAVLMPQVGPASKVHLGSDRAHE